MDEKPAKRRWFQFRLRTLLVLVLVVAVSCWGYWFGWPWWQIHREQSQFVERVKQLRAGVVQTAAVFHLLGAEAHCEMDESGGILNGPEKFIFFIWQNAIYCVNYVASKSIHLIGSVDADYTSPLKSVKLFRLAPMPSEYQSQWLPHDLRGYLIDFSMFVINGENNNPGFKYELIYSDPPQ